MKLAILAMIQTPKKIQYDMLSGFSSATNGVNIDAALQKVLQIPKVVAEIPTGKSLVLAINTVLKPLAMPNLAPKINITNNT